MSYQKKAAPRAVFFYYLEVWVPLSEMNQSGEFSYKYETRIIAKSVGSFVDWLGLDHAILP
ncbi:hypothetical protein [Pseudalkalibacillus hwajinpoensis]|uniref:hypothetical protein n=1 Tax=Guptibacillus hwajinpoensis TaxID=208199 RepID=UPI001CD2B515|nr:hypothetical protein [Pseudalkalibacillus hwajinpoensis]MCA0993795.1 hypothetical protein [Pseudalkalibacillus hwajinpoensis]